MQTVSLFSRLKGVWVWVSSSIIAGQVVFGEWSSVVNTASLEFSSGTMVNPSCLFLMSIAHTVVCSNYPVKDRRNLQTKMADQK